MKKTVILLTLLIVSLTGNFILLQKQQKVSAQDQSFTEREKRYPLLAKRIMTDYPNDLLLNFLGLRKKLYTLVEPYKDTLAVSFEYLPTGTHIGINADTEFTEASLLKVPVVMAYYRKKERQGIKEDPTVTITQDELDDKYGTLYKKGAGYHINLKDAVKFALQDSDNTANRIVADQVTKQDFDDVYEGLDIPMTYANGWPVITTEQYSSVLKALYFAAVLNEDDSQEILSLLTQTKFHDMLPAGVPPEILVAHKIGLIDKQIYQDCGIIFVPHRHYTLCVVSKSDKETAKKRISEISKTVYDYVAGVK